MELLAGAAITAVALVAVAALWRARRQAIGSGGAVAADGVSIRVQCRPRSRPVQVLTRAALTQVGLREGADGHWCRPSGEAVVLVAEPVLTDHAVLVDTTIAEVPALLQSLVEVLLANGFTIHWQAERQVRLRRRWQAVTLTVSPA